MWRWLTGIGAIVAVMAAGILLWGRSTPSEAVIPALSTNAAIGRDGDGALPDSVPEATPRTREQKRFDRYDKDRDAKITRDEYLLARRKAYAKLDANHDGTLSFDEWAIKATTKFAAADHDRSGAMSAAEFATTAVKRKPASRLKCPPVAAPPEEG